MQKHTKLTKYGLSCSLALLLAMAAGCSSQPKSNVKKMPAGKEYSGYLSDYTNLKPNPKFENTVAFLKGGDSKLIRNYVAIMIEPVEVYVATDGDESKINDKARVALTSYFEGAIQKAVGDAFPVVKEKGPLVLRLRTALIGVDTGAEVSAADKAANADSSLDRVINIGKVGVEMELVDSVTGEQIVAVVDRQNLGEGAEIGSTNLSKEEKSVAAKAAFDGWAKRLRLFLDSVHELSADDIARVEETNQPYGTGTPATEEKK